MSPALALQAHVFQAIKAALPAARVGSHPVRDTPLPYIMIGEDDEADNPVGGQISLTVHVYSSREGKHECADLQWSIAQAVESAANASTEWEFTALHQSFRRTFLDDDRTAWHGVSEFTALVNQK